MKVGDKLQMKSRKTWGGGILQEIVSIIEITECLLTRCEYKTIEILKAKNVNPRIKNPLYITGGFSYEILNKDYEDHDCDLGVFVKEIETNN